MDFLKNYLENLVNEAFLDKSSTKIKLNLILRSINKRMEPDFFYQVMKHSDFNQTKAAKLMGISKSSFNRLVKKNKITVN